MIDIDSLAQEIRRVDGSNDLGAGALAEALMPFVSAAIKSATDILASLCVTDIIVRAACDATLLGELEDGKPYHLEPDDARKAIAAAFAALKSIHELSSSSKMDPQANFPAITALAEDVLSRALTSVADVPEPAPVPTEGATKAVPTNPRLIRGEWVASVTTDAGGVMEFRSKAEADAVKWLAEVTAPEAVKPVAWCQPNYEGKIHPRKFMVVYEDSEMGSAVFDDEAEAREHFEKASIAWNCYLFGLLPALAAPAPEAVKVKPLEWTPFEAHTPIGRYRVSTDQMENGRFGAWLNSECIGTYISVALAKAAAQSDYERRILSALNAEGK